MSGKGMGGHQSRTMEKDEWLTPPEILEALGPFDLDPCAPIKRPWSMAEKHYTKEDNGLFLPWEGRVWCNPPYLRREWRWLEKCAFHGNAIALTFARTETAQFFKQVWGKADGLLFIKERLHFYDVDGNRSNWNAGAPSVLVAYGDNNVESLRTSGITGALVEVWGV